MEQSEQGPNGKMGWRPEEAAKREHCLGQLAPEFCPYLKAVAKAFQEEHRSMRSIWGREALSGGRNKADRSRQETGGDRAVRPVAQDTRVSCAQLWSKRKDEERGG